jgi:methane/ammonia monooxygenase subunit B
MHAMVNVKEAGPIAGPASWMNISGNWDDFTNPITTLTGKTIDTGDIQLQQWRLLARTMVRS